MDRYAMRSGNLKPAVVLASPKAFPPAGKFVLSSCLGGKKVGFG